jgi:tRNA pseudouridine38-40 synthase
MSDQRYRLTVEYEGSDFFGWQWQPQQRTVQAVLESALAGVFGQAIRIYGSGRTDAGVHALGQIAHFEAPARFETPKLELALNANLPPDVRVHHLLRTTPDFHARFSARWRWYRYRMFIQPSALERHFGWYLKYQLNADILRQCAEHLPGIHDFTAFSKIDLDAAEDKHGGNCLVYAAGWELLPEEFRFHIVANRFLRHMVRTLVGAMVDVARGHFDREWFLDLLNNTLKSDRVFNAPAQGLCLMQVGYGEYPYREADLNDKLILSIK